MAFQRSEVRRILKAAGMETVTTDVVDEICELHTADRDLVAKSHEAAVQKLEKQLEDAAADLAEAKKATGGDPKALADLQKEFDDYKAQVETEKTTAALSTAKEAALREAGFSESVISLLAKDEALAAVKMGKDGKPEGIEDAVKSMAEKHATLIKTSSTEPGHTPPAGGGDGTPATDLGKLSMADYIKARQKE